MNHIANVQFAQVHFQVLWQIFRQARDHDLVELVHDKCTTNFASGAFFLVYKVQRHANFDDFGIRYALKVQVHDLLLVWVTLNVTQQSALGFFTRFEHQNVGVKPFLLRIAIRDFLIQLQCARGFATAVNDCWYIFR